MVAMKRRALFSLVVVGCVILVSGCGGSTTAGRKPVFAASGSVKLNGAPLADAVVTFAPTGGQPTAFGTTDEEGNFSLTTYDFQDGAAAGPYKVIITKSAAQQNAGGSGSGADHEAEADAANKGHGAKGSGAQGLVPQIYTSFETTTLTAEVKASGENKFPVFELK